jgi:alginate O-acetyltransferase complex protein AlgJ
MERVAKALASFVAARGLLERPRYPRRYDTVRADVTNRGDIAAMLELPGGFTPGDAAAAFGLPLKEPVDRLGAWLGIPSAGPLYGPERATLRRLEPLWRADTKAEVLVLGDSFSNIYSLGAMGWGESAGFVEHLSRALGRPLDRITQNDNGAFATRERLARKLARGQDRLAGKKLVIWQFAARELAVGDWRLVDLTLGEPGRSTFFVPEAGKEAVITGTIAAITSSPRPGDVAYADHIIAMHLEDVSTADGSVRDAQAIVYTWGMRNRKWTPAARFRVDREVRLRVRDWAEVEPTYGALKMSPLPDPDLALEPPCWGEVLE